MIDPGICELLRNLDEVHGLDRRIKQIEARDPAALKAGAEWPDQEAIDGVLARDYARRNRKIIAALAVATMYGMPAGFRIDPANPEWPVAYIETPHGQVSWHLPQHSIEWDGHTFDEKQARLAAWLTEHEAEHAERDTAHGPRAVVIDLR